MAGTLPEEQESTLKPNVMEDWVNNISGIDRIVRPGSSESYDMTCFGRPEQLREWSSNKRQLAGLSPFSQLLARYLEFLSLPAEQQLDLHDGDALQNNFIRCRRILFGPVHGSQTIWERAITYIQQTSSFKGIDFWALADTLGMLPGLLGPAPAGATKRNFFLPVTAMFGKWCQRLCSVNQAHSDPGQRITSYGPKMPVSYPLRASTARQMKLKSASPGNMHNCANSWFNFSIGEHGRSTGFLNTYEYWLTQQNSNNRYDTFLPPRAGSFKEPDFHTRPYGCVLPTVVFESGWSESYPELIADKNLWLDCGAPHVNVVFLIPARSLTRCQYYGAHNFLPCRAYSFGWRDIVRLLADITNRPGVYGVPPETVANLVLIHQDITRLRRPDSPDYLVPPP
ncbi:hypothetical protein CNMCM5793_009215 [Aspergillus hiratsukae]|uniref:Uncharacterized protein n=1 Tax=Aspergillus hiratsukae TaxID=1194566 RepID=A0A8H6P1Z7_9EURO|nr:hypothetical protein CNMCM5793_009215 [Aspergillus hiratsukae]KAF7155688.1 hypothetical protein CNMCM6106_005970 [Aspergillus hiratsukae]